MTTTNGTKYTFVCDPDECDSLVELTTVDGFGFPNGVISNTCPCGREMSYISATILSSEQPTTKEDKMETTESTLAERYDNSAKIIVKNTNGGELVYEELSPYDINCLFVDTHYQKQRLTKLDEAINAVQCIILDSYSDSDDQETLRSIAEALDIALTKTVEWSATMYVSGTMDVDLFEDFDIESELSDNLQVSAWNGDIEVEEYHVEDARES
jgi:hypothetical protein